MIRILKYLWAFPNTLLGLPFVILGYLSKGDVVMKNGTLEVQGSAISFLLHRLVPIQGGAAAITLGHIIVGRNQSCLDSCRSHELVHVRQAEQWGPFFIPAYFSSSALALLRGKNPYLDNFFEIQARELE